MLVFQYLPKILKYLSFEHNIQSKVAPFGCILWKVKESDLLSILVPAHNWPKIWAPRREVLLK